MEQWDYDKAASFRAAESGDIATLLHLLSGGADVNERSLGNMTPLIGAARKNQVETVRLLLDQWADPTLWDANGSSALDWAAALGLTDISRLLAERVSNKHIVSAIECAREKQQNVTARLLAEVLFRRDFADQDFPRLLIYAALYGGADTVRGVLDHGQVLMGDLKPINSWIMMPFTNPLAAAASQDNLEAVGVLLRRGINIHPVSCGVALLEAAKSGSIRVASLLLQKGASMTVYDGRNKTALVLARENGHAEIVEMLKKAGAPE